MHLCIVTAVIWLVGALVAGFSDIPAIRRYRWRVILVLLLTLPFVVYQISVAIWTKNC